MTEGDQRQGAHRPLATHDLSPGGVDDSAAPLFLVHPVSFHSRTWQPVTRRLRHRGRRIAVDLPGHGESRYTEGRPLDWESLAHDVLAAVATTGTERSISVGHSIGGALLAIGEVLRPGTFRGLWLFEPIITRSAESPAEIRGEDAGGPRPRRTVFESVDAAYDRYRANPAMARVDDEALRAYVDHGFDVDGNGRATLRCPPEVAFTMAWGWTGSRVYERLGEIDCPVHVVHGDLVTYQARWAAELPDALRYGTVEAHDVLHHLGPLEQPGLIAGSIDAFVARVIADAR